MLGFEIVAFTFLNVAQTCTDPNMTLEQFAKKAHKWIGKNKSVIFSGTGDGIRGKNCVMASLHRDFTDYTRFISDFRRQWGTKVLDIESFTVTLRKTPQTILVSPLRRNTITNTAFHLYF
jgi:hypothetical protein